MSGVAKGVVGLKSCASAGAAVGTAGAVGAAGALALTGHAVVGVALGNAVFLGIQKGYDWVRERHRRENGEVGRAELVRYRGKGWKSNGIHGNSRVRGWFRWLFVALGAC